MTDRELTAEMVRAVVSEQFPELAAATVDGRQHGSRRQRRWQFVDSPRARRPQ